MKAKLAALRFLSIKSRSSWELKKKLTSKGFSAQEVDQAISECRRLGYLDDGEEARRRSASLKTKGYGARFIALKLKMQGLEAPQKPVKEEAETIRLLLQKPAWRKKEKPKCIAALQRRGFDLETILAVISLS